MEMICDRVSIIFRGEIIREGRMDELLKEGANMVSLKVNEGEDRRAVEAYLMAMQPAASPFLVDGRPSAQARAGKAIFESPRTRCAVCHPGPLHTDLQMHDVGTGPRSARFDTPTLVEIWRTAPYLHNGRARTLREVLTRFNRDDRHGRTSHLSSDEIDALVEYLRSL